MCVFVVGAALPYHDQLQQHLDACNENLGLISEDPDFLWKVITLDESWMHCRNPLTKWESECWNRPNERKLRKV